MTSLASAVERVDRTAEPLVRVEHLSKSFAVRSPLSLLRRTPQSDLLAVDDVSFEIRRREILGLAGESGCGKSTTGEMLVRLLEPTTGSISFDGRDVAHLRGADLKGFRRRVQMIFQDPYQSLNPRSNVYDTVAEPLRVHGRGSRQEQLTRVVEALEEAELRPAREYLGRFPHELSGGQRQRLAIARAMVLKPSFVVADEPVSMLDVSVRAGVLNLLKRLQGERGLTMLYVSHDLSTVKYLSQRMATMYLGSIVEIAPTRSMPRAALHPYTRALFAAVPIARPGFSRPPVPILGDLSRDASRGLGCAFADRCPEALPICRHVTPRLRPVHDDHTVACHLFHDERGQLLDPSRRAPAPPGEHHAAS
jgi:peptide/nickel transport system ATP-binding protein